MHIGPFEGDERLSAGVAQSVDDALELDECRALSVPVALKCPGLHPAEEQPVTPFEVVFGGERERTIVEIGGRRHGVAVQGSLGGTGQILERFDLTAGLLQVPGDDSDQLLFSFAAASDEPVCDDAVVLLP